MPYIDQESRNYFAKYVDNLPEIGSAGELNYFIIQVIKKYMCNTVNYSMIATVGGVIDNIAHEFYRRVAVPFEKGKIKTNGDVF